MRNFAKLSVVALACSMSTVALAAKTLVYCSEASPSSFNPQLVTDGASMDASSQTIYNRLVEFKHGSTEIEPGLAESWTISPDGKIYTFHLRKGVKFQSSKLFKPTHDFNADDVIFSFERQLDTNNPYHIVSGGSYEYFMGMDMPNIINKIVKVNDHTIQFELKQPNAPFLADLAMDFSSILSKEYADKMLKAGTPSLIDSKPLGTGPFQLVNYQKDAVIRYKAFDNYWKGRVKLDRLVFAITPNASVRNIKLQKGECQVMAYPNMADLKLIEKDPNVTLMEAPGLNIGYLSFNVTKKPFNNVDVRKALSYAVNKKAILDSVFQGAGQIAKNPMPPTMWSYNDDIKDFPYNPKIAKKLLAKAGYPNGFETEIWAMPVSRPYNPNARRMAEIIQSDWAKVGVRAKIVSYEWGEYLQRMKAGDAPTGLMGWTGDNGDPDNFLGTLLGCAAARQGSNYAKWCYKPFDTLIKEAAMTSDHATRVALYKKAQVIFKEQAPWITIAHSTTYLPVRKEVTVYVIDPFGHHQFDGDVDLAK